MADKRTQLISARPPGAFFLAVIGFFALWLSGCGSSAVSSAAVLPAAEPTQRATTTRELPAVSVYTLTEEGYPDPSAAADGGGLPAPVVIASSNSDGVAPPTPTSIATAMLPTRTPAPTAAPAETATPQPTFTPPTLPQTSDTDHYWLHRPVPEGGSVWTNKTYPYGSTRNQTLRPHHGVEFDVDYDTPIMAAGSGTVVVAGDDLTTAYGPQTDFYGRLVVIQHDFALDGRPVYTLYGHLNEVFVTPRQKVQAREVIGLSGATGVADGPHMHFEVRVGTNTYASTRNPLLWLWPFPERGSIAGRVVFADGTAAHEAPVTVRRIDAQERAFTTTTYAAGGVNADEVWQENFVLDDVPAGYYEVVVKAGREKYTAEVWVYARRTSFVEIVID